MPPPTAPPSLRKHCVWPAAVTLSNQQVSESFVLPRDEPRVPPRPVRAGGQPTQALQQWLWLFRVRLCCCAGLWALLPPAVANCVLTCICLEGGNLGNRNSARRLAGNLASCMNRCSLISMFPGVSMHLGDSSLSLGLSLSRAC